MCSKRLVFFAGVILGLLAGGAHAAEVAWTYVSPTGYVDASPAIGDIDGDGEQDMVMVTVTGRILAVDSDRRTLWQRDIRGPIHIPPTLVRDTNGEGMKVLVLNKPGNMYCYDGATGDLIWEYKLPSYIEWGATAIAAGDLDGDGSIELITGDRSGTVVCLSSAGELKWSYQGPHGWTLCPAVGDLDGDGQLEVLIGGTESPLLCLEADGTERWRLDQPGRGSSPVVCDLNGDGKLEVVVGIGSELTAVDATGKVLWSFEMDREIDSAITVADADEDGVVEVYAIDLSGMFACVSAQGELRWTADVIERVRRSPSVADIDGDGAIEILVAGYSRTLYVFNAQGYLEDQVALSSTVNATPTVWMQPQGPVVVCPTDDRQITAFAWPNATTDATVLWPEYRLSSTRDAAVGGKQSSVEVQVSDADFGEYYVGTNRFAVRIANPGERALRVQLEVETSLGGTSDSVITSSEAVIDHEMLYVIGGRGTTNVSFVCSVFDGDKRIARRTHRVHVAPFRKEMNDLQGTLTDLVDTAMRLPAPDGIVERAHYLRASMADLEARVTLSGTQPDATHRKLRDDIANIRMESTRLLALARAAEGAQNRNGGVIVSAANPWAPFGGMDEIVEGRNGTPDIAIEAFGGETESAALNVFNFTAGPKMFRIELDPFSRDGADDGVRAEEIVSLHEVIDVPAEGLVYAADAIPAMNQARVITVPGWSARQVWLNVNTASLTPAEWHTTVHLRSLELEPLEIAAPLQVTVWDVAQPDEQELSLCHWGYVHNSRLKDFPEAALADKVAHGTNVFCGLFAPQATYNDAGEIVGEIDYTAHDDFMRKHAPHGITLFLSYQGGLRGPGGHEDPAYRKAHVTWLRAWVDHLADMGIGYEKFALYPVDEPGLNDGLVERYLSYAKLAREADPKIQMYTDPVGRITTEELERMTPYVDIWCPNRDQLVLDNEDNKLDIIKASGKTIWTYECLANAKEQSPLGYYRAQAWLSWHHGFTGIGFWSYCTSQDDPWFGPKTTRDYLLVYQGDGVVPSKRWEAIRDGVEDYSMLAALRKAADKADARGTSLEHVAAARKLLKEDATAIGEFCGKDTLPGQGGASEVRKIADERWEKIQETRRQMVALLAAFGGA